jgi:hypothetical protein
MLVCLRIHLYTLIALLCLAFPVLHAQEHLVLKGTITAAQNHSLIDLPFDVAQGVHRLTVDVHYTDREKSPTPTVFAGPAAATKTTSPSERAMRRPLSSLERFLRATGSLPSRYPTSGPA